MFKGINSVNDVGVALTEQEIISESHQMSDFISEYSENLSFSTYNLNILDGLSFFQHNFKSKVSDLSFGSYINFFARTDDVINSGLFPHFCDGLHSDNLLILKLIAGRKVALIRERLVFYRSHPQSFGLSAPYVHLVYATEDYLNAAIKFIGSRDDMSLLTKNEFISGLVQQALNTLRARIPPPQSHNYSEVNYFMSLLTDVRARWRIQ
jgi:hypothetical protein